MDISQSWSNFYNELTALQTMDLSNEAVKEVSRKLLQMNYVLDQTSLIAVIDQHGNISYVNRRLCELTNYAREDLMNQPYELICTGPDCESKQIEMEEKIKQGYIWHGQVKSKTKDGASFWVYSVIVPFTNDYGETYQYIVVNHDITESKKMEISLEKNKNRYRLIAENSSDLIAKVDLEGNFDYVSPSFEKLIGFSPSYLETRNVREILYSQDDIKNLIKGLEKVNEDFRIELCLRTRRGNVLETEAKVTLLYDENGAVYSYLFAMRDITEQKKSEKMIAHLAYHDALTDLPNRRYFMEHIQSEVKRSKEKDCQFAVAFLDLDQFKHVNDTLGHDMGDAILISASEKIKELLDEDDMIARLGGDEFTILFANINHKEELANKVKKIKHAFEDALNVGDKLIHVSFSMGVSIFPKDGADADTLLARADTALYAIKTKNRNGHAFFDVEMERKFIKRMKIETELKKAIERKQLYLHFQPKVNLQKQKLIGYEALLRWKHPKLGQIPPCEFIPIAEETGLIHTIGAWVLREACLQNKKWQEKGFTKIPISVNVSARQLQRTTFFSDVEDVLQETKLDPKWLTLEVTESVFNSSPIIEETLEKVRDIGIGISIDDFGKGFSSFSYIKRMPIDIIKIDRSFIQDINKSKESQAIVHAIITLAEALEIKVVVEGIELVEQLEFFTDKNFVCGQGYLFSRPMAASVAEQYLEEHNFSAIFT